MFKKVYPSTNDYVRSIMLQRLEKQHVPRDNAVCVTDIFHNKLVTIFIY